MFKRKIYDKLLKWKEESEAKHALLIEGARRIGKTTVAEELGKNEFVAYKTIDFSKNAEKYSGVFKNLDNIDDFYSEFFLQLGMSPLPNGSLIIFDEIQFLPIARQAIKHLVADGRYYFIETGSLVSIKENTQGILIPSEEESIEMYPMDYEEFLWALGLNFEADTLCNYYSSRKKPSLDSHQQLIKHFRMYLSIGGMPQAVAKYVETKDYYEVDKIKKRIVNLYEEDLKKIDNKYGTICSLVWKEIPSMLSKHSTRFLVSSVDERADSILFKNTLDKLIESKMVIPVFRCNDPSSEFVLGKDETKFKLYFSDVGLFTSIIYSSERMEDNDVYQRLILDKLHTNLGMLYENACAQSICASGYEQFYYSWKEKKDDDKETNYEIDFIISKNGKIIPIEVKSNKVSSNASIETFRKKFSKRIKESYYIKSKPLDYGDNITYLPFYMLFCL